MSKFKEKFAALKRAWREDLKRLDDARRRKIIEAGLLLRRIVDEDDKEERKRLAEVFLDQLLPLLQSYFVWHSVFLGHYDRAVPMINQEKGRMRRAQNAAIGREERKRRWLDIRKSLKGGFRDERGYWREADRDLNGEADRRLAASLSTPHKKISARTIANLRHKERWLDAE